MVGVFTGPQLATPTLPTRPVGVPLMTATWGGTLTTVSPGTTGAVVATEPYWTTGMGEDPS